MAKNGELACATCHQEHRGKDFDLTRLSNQNCQICHIRQFKSLSTGHPRFEQFPYERRSRIRFDHVSHMDKHFKKKGGSKEFTCTGCHQPDSQGSYMLVVAMETSCAGCHNHANEVKGRDIDFFAVPKLDRKLLSRRGKIGDWPKFARQELTPFMKFLLSGGDLSASDLNMDLSSLQGKKQLAAAEKVVWAVKELFFDLRSRGHEGLKARLTKAAEKAGYKLEHSQLNRMLAQIPAETVASATDEWFPLLKFEIALRNSNKSDVSRSTIKKTYPESAAVLASLKQRRPPKKAAPKKDEEEEVDLKALLAGDGEEKEVDLKALLAGDGEEKEGEDADLKALLAGDGEEKEEEDADLKALLAGYGDEDEEKEEQAALEDPKTGAEWATAGGWYRSGLAIRYRSFGHANPFLQSWLDLMAGLGGENSASGNGQESSLITAIGVKTTKCLKCHGLDAEQGSSGRARISWTAIRQVPNQHKFNRFKHKPHFSLANLMGDSNNQGCLACHRIDEESSEKFQAAFESGDMLKFWAPGEAFASNFENMTKATCTECHIPSEVGNSCITCHNYHVGLISPAFLQPVKSVPATPNNK